MVEINSENVEAYADVARAVCHIPETEPVVIFSIAGQRNQDCGRPCQGCPLYSECFPATNPEEQVTWKQFLSQLIQKEVEDES